jgi:hypothetical protein
VRMLTFLNCRFATAVTSEVVAAPHNRCLSCILHRRHSGSLNRQLGNVVVAHHPLPALGARSMTLLAVSSGNMHLISARTVEIVDASCDE